MLKFLKKKTPSLKSTQKIRFEDQKKIFKKKSAKSLVPQESQKKFEFQDRLAEI